MTQTDLPRHVKSGLRDAIEVLRGVDGVELHVLREARDVVRHPLVARSSMPTTRDARDAKDAEAAG